MLINNLHIGFLFSFSSCGKQSLVCCDFVCSSTLVVENVFKSNFDFEIGFLKINSRHPTIKDLILTKEVLNQIGIN